MSDFKFNSKRVFIVDDTSFLRSSLIKELVELGFERGNISEFENGKTALDSLASGSKKADLILTDWNMPIMNGLEFIRALRKLGDNFREVPVVFVTTVSEKEKVLQAIQYKISGYILKPIEVEKLKETIEDIFFHEVA